MNKGFFIPLFLLLGCTETSVPKPMGYFRIGLPSKEYILTDLENCTYQFEINSQAITKEKENCWMDIEYPSIKATIQLTHHNFDVLKLEKLIDDGRRMAYSHTKVADGMEEKLFLNSDKKVYGVLYQMQGQVATSTQFFMTDSTDNFLRGCRI